MKNLIYLFVLLGLVSCKKDTLENSKLKIINKFKNKKDQEDIIKFETKYNFKDYNVKISKISKNVKLDFDSNEDAKYFRSLLNEKNINSNINFAGHYIFVYWGCGSNSKASMIIDKIDGKIYDAPTSSLGFDFHKDSRMLIVNPPNNDKNYIDCIYCKPEIYLFNEVLKLFIQLE
jgi:hypothetical protein